MDKEEKILNVIKSIRESFGASVAIYRFGNCYQFYEILKSIFPESKAYESGGHVWTNIDGNFYDIKGKLTKNFELIPVKDESIESFTINKWSDERREKLKTTQ